MRASFLPEIYLSIYLSIAANSQFGRASCTAHSYRALAAERGEAFARFGWWISISLCSAESLHGTSPVRPTQEGLITKSLHGTREKLLMPPAQVIVTHRPG